jgi:hypothetical protein
VTRIGPIELHLELDGEAEPISGHLRRADNRDPVAFTGWVELVQTIEGIRAASRAGEAIPDHLSPTRMPP